MYFMPTPKKTVTKKPQARRLPSRSSIVDRWDLVAKTAITLVAFLIPLFVGNWTPDRWEIHKAAILILGTLVAWVCWTIGRFQRPGLGWRWHPLDWLALVIGMVAVVGTVTSMNPWISISGLQGALSETMPVTLALVSVYFLSARLFTTAHDRFIVWVAVLTGMGLSLLAQMLQFAGWSWLTNDIANDRLFSTMTNSSLQTAIVAAIIGTIGLLLWPKAKELWARLGVAFVVAQSWVVLLLLGQAVAWAVFALGMIVVVINQANRPSQAASRLVFVAVALAAVGMLAQFFDLASYTALPSTAEANLNQTTSAATAWSSVAQRPVLGTGPNTWFDAFVHYRPESFNLDPRWSGRFLRGGMEWAQLLATQGIAGLGAMVGLLIFVGWEAWRRLQREASMTAMTALFLSAVLGVTLFLSTWSLLLLFLAWLSFGLLRAKLATKEVAAPVRPYVAPLGFALTVIAAVVILYPGVKLYASQVYLQRAQQTLNNNGTPAQAIKLLETSRRLDRHNIDAGVLLANAHLWKLQLDLQSNDITQAQQELQLTQTVMRSVVVDNATNPVAFEAENNILNNIAAYVANPEEQANKNFATLRDLEPASPIHDVGYGQTMMVIRARAAANADTTPVHPAEQDRRFQAALSAYTEALRKKPDYLQARAARAEAYLDVANATLALQDAQALTAAAPSAVSFWTLEGRAYAGLNKLDLATAAFEQGITVDSTDVANYVAFSEALSAAKKTTEAKDVLNRGLKAVPGNSDLQAALTALK